MPEIPKSPFQGTPDQDADIFADLDVLAGEVVATAQNNSQTPEPVLPASADKSKPRTRGARKENGNDADTEKVRAGWIKKTEQAIAEAKDLKQLMRLVDLVKSKGGKARLSFPLPKGLPTLLKNDEDFGKELNSLFDRWSERVAETLFGDSEGMDRFRGFLHDVVEGSPDIRMGRFFSMYLERCNSAALEGAPIVIARMKELWKQFLPAIKQELKAGKNRSKEIDLGGAYVLKNDPSREYKVTEISDDGEITYVSVSDGSVLHSSKGKFLKYLQAKGDRLNTQSKDRRAVSRKRMPIDIDDALSDIRNNGNGRSDEDDEMRKAVRRQQSVPGKNGMGNPDTSKATTLDQQSDSLMRNYDDLDGKLGETKRGASLERKRLESAVAAGLQKIAESIPDETLLSAFVRDNKTDLVRAFSSSVLIRLEQLPWTPEEKQFFAETFVEKSIEDFLT